MLGSRAEDVVMVEFQKLISQSELKATYLNMTDDRGKSHGAELDLKHRQKLVIVDCQGRKTSAQVHHDNQIWGTIYNWFADNGIKAGDRIKVRYDPIERHDELPVLHLELIQVAQPVPLSPPFPEHGEGDSTEGPLIPISLEKQLEDFLAANPTLIETGLSMYSDEDGRPGRQYPTDVGVIDLLCQRADGTLLVVELKRGRVSDEVVGQVSRYIGWVKAHLARDRSVAGLILTPEPDEDLKYAVQANPYLALRYFRIRLELVEEADL